MEVSILIPVLDRPESARDVAASICEATPAGRYEIVFLCSPDDLDEIHACQETGERTIVVDWAPGPGDYARKINHGFDQTDTPWILTGADDLHFHDGWLREATAAWERTGKPVLGTNDLCNPSVKRGGHSTHTLIYRPYVDEHGTTFDDGPGVVLHEGYRHQWVDTELVDAAKARGAWAFAADCHVEHLHPLCDRSKPKDATYAKAMNQEDARHDRRHHFMRKTAFQRARRREGVRR